MPPPDDVPAAARGDDRAADVIVIGAGLSGLVCARRLAAAGVDVRVLEARERVGGRLVGVSVGGGVFDLGGQWWSEGQPSLAALADELGVARVPQFRSGAAVVALESAGPRRWWPARMFAALARGRRLAALSRLIGRATGGDAPDAWDRESLASWLAREVMDPDLRQHVALHCELTFAADPGELSLLDYLAQLGATGGWGNPFDREKGGGEHRFEPGAHALPERLAADLGDRVVLGAPVRSLTVDDRGVTVTVDTASRVDGGTDRSAHSSRTQASGAQASGTQASGAQASGAQAPGTRASGGDVHRAKRVVLALPPAAARAIAFTPELPAAALAAIAASRPGAVVKGVATYPRAFWREAGLSGESYLSPGLIRATTDACTADGVAALGIFIVAGEAAAWADAPIEERRAAVCAELGGLFGDEAARPIELAFVDWRRDPWAFGCVAGMPPGARSGGAAWQGPFAGGRIHVAGTEAGRRWPGFMEGAIEAGERIARALLEG